MANMTKTHFQFIAEILLNHVQPVMDKEVYEELVATFAYHLADTNELFNPSLFAEACGVDQIDWDYMVNL